MEKHDRNLQNLFLPSFSLRKNLVVYADKRIYYNNKGIWSLITAVKSKSLKFGFRFYHISERGHMTLVLTWLFPVGICMGADSAISYNSHLTEPSGRKRRRTSLRNSSKRGSGNYSPLKSRRPSKKEF